MATRNSGIDNSQLIIYVTVGILLAPIIASSIYQLTVMNDVGIEFIEKEKNASQVVLNETGNCGKNGVRFHYTAVENDNNSPIEGTLCCSFSLFGFTPGCYFKNL